MITIIGVSLLPVAIRCAGGGTPGVTPISAPQERRPGRGHRLDLSFLPAFLSRVAILLGLVLGTVVAILGPTDFGRIGDASVFQLTTPFHFGLPTFAVGAAISMLIVMLVIMTTSTADTGQQVTNGLRADMLSTSLAAVLNGFSVSAFAQNVGLVAITGIKSRFVVAVCGAILLFLGLFPVLGALVALVPLPVLGGAGALFGTVAHGIRTLSRVDFSGNANLVIVALAIGMGIVPIAVPAFYDEFPEWFQVIFDSGITAADLTAVLLNILFNMSGRDEDDEGPIFSEAPAPATISDADEARLDPDGPMARDLHEHPQDKQ